MRASVCSVNGPPSLLSPQDPEGPALGPSHVRIQTHYVGVNFADVMAAAGTHQFPPPMPFSPLPPIQITGKAGVSELFIGGQTCAPISSLRGQHSTPIQHRSCRPRLPARWCLGVQRRELRAAAERPSKGLGKPFAEPLDGERIDGVYRPPVRLASGKFAVIEKSQEFTLVPWRAALEHHRGKVVTGITRGASVSINVSKRQHAHFKGFKGAHCLRETR